MPGWGEILNEIQEQAQQNGTVDIDGIRRSYLAALQAKTGRSVVVYATDFTAGPVAQISLMDMQGLMEVFRELPGPNLDLILHSPGGQAEATDRLVRYMRAKYEHIRVFVPLAAMSAATMWAMAADEIVMGKHSQLGPIDPQITLPSGITVPAGALIEQFQTVSDECAQDPSRLTGWLPTLQQYPPGLLNVCETAGALAKELVAEWLGSFMLKGNQVARARAAGFPLGVGRGRHAELGGELALTNLDGLTRLPEAVGQGPLGDPRACVLDQGLAMRSRGTHADTMADPCKSRKGEEKRACMLTSPRTSANLCPMQHKHARAGDELLAPGVAAGLIGVHTDTLKRWAAAGRIQALRTPTGHRRYLRSEIEQALRPAPREQDAPQ